MTPWWRRPERLLDAMVVAVAVPTIALASGAAGGPAVKDPRIAQYRAAKMQCEGSRGGPARESCLAEARSVLQGPETSPRVQPVRLPALTRHDRTLRGPEPHRRLAMEACDVRTGLCVVPAPIR